MVWWFLESGGEIDVELGRVSANHRRAEKKLQWKISFLTEKKITHGVKSL
jgi:hypothetical protein